MQKIHLMAMCLIGALTFGLLGCAVKVNRSDVVGTWQMTEDSVALLKPRLPDGHRPRFELRRDGTLVADNLLATAFTDTQPWQRPYSGTGKWSLPPVRRTEGFSVITLHFDTAGGHEPTGITMQVDRDRDGLYIFAWLDEEGGERLSFRR